MEKGKPEALIVGANGLVGAKLSGALASGGITAEGTFNKRHKSSLKKLDLSDTAEIEDFFSKASYRAVFNCANLSGGVDFCQSNPEMAASFHLHATQKLGALCNRMGAVLVFISSDYVFDGSGEAPRKEDDSPNPLNLYGKLKLMAEEWIKANVKKYIIIRTTNVFGWDPETVTANYIMNLYRTVKCGKCFNAPSYLWGNPTFAGDLAEAITELYQNGSRGLFHVVGSSAVNRYDWAMKACDILGLDRSLVKETKEPPAGMIPRPLKSFLDTRKFTSNCRTVLHDMSEGLKLMKSEMGR
ncbi:MAG: SDR family oxidoreductase [Candidatus Omnitrophota bacterium]|nr:SDR family oxidoreductase [Candidatus Omnitrophota bacterium]